MASSLMDDDELFRHFSSIAITMMQCAYCRHRFIADDAMILFRKNGQGKYHGIVSSIRRHECEGRPSGAEEVNSWPPPNGLLAGLAEWALHAIEVSPPARFSHGHAPMLISRRETGEVCIGRCNTREPRR